MADRHKVRILSIDGGGIRGIIPAKVLIAIEEKLQTFSGNQNARIADYFDLVVGTSTGAILGAMLLTPDDQGRPKFTARQALDLYEKKGNFIFNQSKRWGGALRQLAFNGARYDHRNFEKALFDNVGGVMLSQLLKPCLITTYDVRRKSSFFFRQHENKPSVGDFLLTDVLRSTAAAPTYFQPAQIRMVGGKPDAPTMINLDGGVFANNPAMCAYAEARGMRFENWCDTEDDTKECPTAKNMMILSLGTGGGHLDFGQPEKVKSWKLLDWAKKTPEIMMDGGFDTVNFQLKQLFSSLMKDEYIRNFKRVDYVMPQGQNKPPYSPDMADASPENIAKLVKAGEDTVSSASRSSAHELSLDDYIKELVRIQEVIDGEGEELLG